MPILRVNVRQSLFDLYNANTNLLGAKSNGLWERTQLEKVEKH